jgi:CRISPR-associated protein Cas8c/Csd1 subtype I-C
MIAELVKQADLMGLTGREPFRSRPIHWLIELDDTGQVIGFTSTVGETTTSKGKLKEKKGKIFTTTTNYLLGSPNQHNWNPDFLTGPAVEVFPGGVDGHNPKPEKQQKFFDLTIRAQKELPTNAIINAIVSFLKMAKSLSTLPSAPTSEGDIKELMKDECRLGFRVAGKLALEDAEIRKWWEKTRHAELLVEQTGQFSQMGEDSFQVGEGIIAESSPCVFGNVPLASFNAAPFYSYALGKQTAKFRLDTAEKAAVALNALLKEKDNHLYMGDQVAVFWATSENKNVDCSFLALIETDDSRAVRDYLESIWVGHSKEINKSAFTLLLLEKGTGRFAVKSWSSDSLDNVSENFKKYLEAIRLRNSAPVGIRSLAECTIAQGTKANPAGHIYSSLLNTAWKGIPLSVNLLKSAIQRQSIEFAKGYSANDKTESFLFKARRRARTALIKLYFHSNKEITMNETTHETQPHPAYLCGRVLAVLDTIHDKAHGNKTASSPASRYYGSASSTPALVFPRLCKLAAIHLEKIGGGLAYILENGVPKDKADPPLEHDFDGLAQLIARFNADAQWPRTLSLEDQGRFAIGFYYEKTRKWPKYCKGKNPKGDDGETEVASDDEPEGSE